MEKYTKGLKDKLKPKREIDGTEKVEPFRDAQSFLQKASFAEQLKEEFFNEAFQDIMIDYFEVWIRTEPHAVKEREFLYHSLLALGDVKNRLISYEMRGKNAKYIQQKAQEGANEGNE